MALPKINEFPNYELVIPSTKDKVSYRPFLVKEQKVMMMALESQDSKQIINAMINTIKACVKEDINYNKLTSFDIEFMFVKMRGKSVGETTKIRYKCKECEAENDLVIDFDDIKLELPNYINYEVKLTDNYTIVLKFPQWSELNSNDDLGEDTTATELIHNVIKNVLKELRTEDELILFKDESKDDIENFIESLTTEQFNKIMEFIQNIPQLKHDVKFECTECKTLNEITLQGPDDFFS